MDEQPQVTSAQQITSDDATRIDAPGAETASVRPAEASEEASAGPRIIALMNQKGGVGKTTTTVNIGAALAHLGHRALMIDLDPQAHLSLSLGVDVDNLDHSIYDLLTDDTATAAETVLLVDDGQGHNLGILPAEVNLAGAESELAEQLREGTPQTVLRDKTRDLVKQFDYVIIDCPPSLGLLTINALTTASEVIVPMQAHFLALQGLSKLLETVQMVRGGINPSLIVSGIVLCMFEGQTILASEVTRDLQDFLAQARGTDAPWATAELFEPAIRRNIKLAESPSFGQSIFAYAPESNGAKDYEKLAKAVIAHGVTAT